MAVEQQSAKRYRKAFWSLLGALFLFRLWFLRTLPLSGDEAYHWEWSRHPAFGYYDHPGLTAYLIRLFTFAFGRSTEFTVRLPALVMLTLTAVACFRFARFMVKAEGGADETADKAGFMAGLLVFVTPIFAVFSLYISTDPPLIFFWTLSLYLLYRAFQTGSWPVWMGAGIAVGLALMSKFLAFLIVPAAAVAVLASKDGRAWLRRPQPYVAAACALLVWSPFLVWNATHAWATFMFNFVYRQESRTFAPQYAPEFVAGQVLALSPGLFALALFAIWRSFRDGRRPREPARLFLEASTLVPVAYFLYVSFSRRVGIHWPAAAWIGALVGLACRWAGEKPAFKRWMTASLALGGAMTVGLHLAVHIPPQWLTETWSYRGSPNRINTKQQAERFGWHELGQHVQTVYGEMARAQAGGDAALGPAGKPGVFIIGGEYGFAAMVAFYTPDQLPTHLWAPRRVHGENYRFWDDYPSLKGMDAIYVVKREVKAQNAIPKLKEHFREVGEIEKIPITVGGQEVRTFCLIRCRAFNGRTPEWEKPALTSDAP